MACRNFLAAAEIVPTISASETREPDHAPTSEATPDVQLVADPTDSPSEEVVTAWVANPQCVECGANVESVADSALLVGPGRVAHRDRCFVPALIRLNPLLNQLAAQKRAKEVTLRSPSIATEAHMRQGVQANG